MIKQATNGLAYFLHSKRAIFLGLLLAFTPGILFSQDFLLTTLQSELQKNWQKLESTPIPPYYSEYRLFEFTNETVKTSKGSLKASQTSKRRVFTPKIRIGSYQFDNTFRLGERLGVSFNFPTFLPIEDSVLAFQQLISTATDAAYKQALEGYAAALNDSSKAKESIAPCFTQEAPETYFEPPLAFTSSQKYFENELKETTKYFAYDDDILSSEATFVHLYTREYLLTSEGTSIVQNDERYELHLEFVIRCEDGTLIPYLKSFKGRKLHEIPSQDSLRAELQGIMALIMQLKKAPAAEPYTGPAILSAEATGIFFHEIFGHRIEGHRLRSKMDSQTFKDQLTKEIVPRFLSINFDPTMEQFENHSLFGHYIYDSEGIKARKVQAVDKGIFKEYLMSRLPTAKNTHSNGHGRSQVGSDAVSRQSNMFVTSSKQYTNQELRKMLVNDCKRNKKEYGYFFKEVAGGFTGTSRYSPNVFNIIPLVVYKVYIDGRPDELVKGVTLIGTPLAMFSEIKACGDKSSIFNGYCGAESGMVPVSTIAPAMLVNKIETQRQIEVPSTKNHLPSPINTTN